MTHVPGSTASQAADGRGAQLLESTRRDVLERRVPLDLDGDEGRALEDLEIRDRVRDDERERRITDTRERVLIGLSGGRPLLPVELATWRYSLA